MATLLPIAAVAASGYTTSRTKRSRWPAYHRQSASTHKMPSVCNTAKYVTFWLTCQGSIPTLVFDGPTGSSHRAKSVSRRNTIGQVIATMVAHVTSGHCQRAGSDQRSAPGPDSTRPSSGIIQKKSSEEFSSPRHTRRNAGIR
jgi:hypothetical protein